MQTCGDIVRVMRYIEANHLVWGESQLSRVLMLCGGWGGCDDIVHRRLGV